MTRTDRVEVDVVVIGAGPAGLAAAVTASSLGRRVMLVDEGPRAGGQIWRHHSPATRLPASVEWLDRLERSTVGHRRGTTVVAVTRSTANRFELLTEGDSGSSRLTATSLVLATGARELFLPFPGWTLPGVVGVGALQALVKTGLDVSGKRVALLGTGPLMLPVAALLAKRGAHLVIVGEQASLARVARFSASLLTAPATLRDAAMYRLAFAGTRYRLGTWVVAAEGRDGLESVTVTDGRRRWAEPCDYLGASFGLAPNLELARHLGCEVEGAGAQAAVRLADDQSTSVGGVFGAGEIGGVAGVHVAIAEGIIAAHGAAVAPDGPDARRARSVRDAGRRQARAMAVAFALRPELRAITTPECIVCRCEDVRVADLSASWTRRQAKLYRRVGMGPCQGRICGLALETIHGWERDSVRTPLQPALVSTLMDDGQP